MPCGVVKRENKPPESKQHVNVGLQRGNRIRGSLCAPRLLAPKGLHLLVWQLPRPGLLGTRPSQHNRAVSWEDPHETGPPRAAWKELRKRQKRTHLGSNLVLNAWKTNSPDLMEPHTVLMWFGHLSSYQLLRKKKKTSSERLKLSCPELVATPGP